MKLIIHFIMFSFLFNSTYGQTKEYHYFKYSDHIIFEDTSITDTAIYGPHWIDIYNDLKYFAENVRTSKNPYFEDTTPWGTPYLYTTFNGKQYTLRKSGYQEAQYYDQSPICKRSDSIDWISLINDSILADSNKYANRFNAADSTKDYFVSIIFEFYYTYTGKLYKAKLIGIVGTPDIVEQRENMNFEFIIDYLICTPAMNGKYPVQFETMGSIARGMRRNYPVIKLE